MTSVLNDGFYDVPAGRVATVVTHLEMTAKPVLRDAQLPAELTLRHVVSPTIAWYRALFSRIGALDWLWFSRLQMPDKQLAAILSDPGVEIFTLTRAGEDLALLELDFRQAGACELAFFGLDARLIGQGAGRFLMNKAIKTAWSRPINLFHVHTCTLDSPQALGFYRRSGFEPVRQQIEIAPDPRLSGALPRDAGGHVPLFDPSHRD